MLAELDVLVFLKSGDTLDRVAERVFGSLKSPYQLTTSEELGGSCYEASGLGFTAVLYANEGDVQDPWFESYEYALEITSEFWCVALDSVDLEGPLSEYYGRQLAFELNLETATSILVETDEEGEWFDVLAFRRNPQYRLDQPPTTPKVMEIERRREFVPFDEEDGEGEDEEWEDGEDDEETGGEET